MKTNYHKLKKVQREKKKKEVTEKKLDSLWSLRVKERDGFKCQVPDCNKTTYLNSHHIFSRSSRSVRWYLRNGITLCSGHHTLNSAFSAHKAPADFIEWLKIYLGEEEYQSLRARAHLVEKRDRDTIFSELSA